MAFIVDDLVDVRASESMTWRPGVVRAVEGGCYKVELDTPISADVWSGVTRKYGGSDMVGTAATPVFVYEHCDEVIPDELIRPQGG